jgi:hypothetical protein
MFQASFRESSIYYELRDVAQERHTIKWSNSLQQFALRDLPKRDEDICVFHNQQNLNPGLVYYIEIRFILL